MKKKWIALPLLVACLFTGCEQTQEVQQGKNTQQSEPIKEEKNTEEIETQIVEEFTQVIEESTEEIEEVTGVLEKIEPYEDITMAFVGDVYVSDRLYDRYMEQEDVTGFMDQTVASNFRDVDIMVANHEYACTDLSDAHRDTRQLFNFKSPTSREYIWQELGVDVLSLANNHAMDFGEQSLFDTLDTLEDLDIPAIGAGRNLEDAKEAEIFEMQGKKVALLASSRFIVDADWYATTNSPGVLTTYESTPYFGIVKDEITRLKEEEGCDFVAIYVHFGKEKTNQIIESQVDIAHGYIDAGADLVMGAHAHTLQGIEFYKEKPIYYNLGNFLFSSKAVDTMLVNIEIHEDNSCSTSILPCLSSDFYVKAVEGEEKQRILSYVEDISVNAVIDADGNVREK